jgi:hypothetical protein
LTPAELTAGQQAHMKRRQMMGMGRGLGPDQAVGMGRNKPAFGDFDLNGDGMLDAQEFDEAHNKRVAERAQQGYPMKNRANPPAFDELDTNGDGAVSPQEFAAHQAQRVPQNESE